MLVYTFIIVSLWSSLHLNNAKVLGWSYLVFHVFRFNSLYIEINYRPTKFFVISAVKSSLIKFLWNGFSDISGIFCFSSFISKLICKNLFSHLFNILFNWLTYIHCLQKFPFLNIVLAIVICLDVTLISADLQ